MKNQDHTAGVGNFPGGRGKVEDGKSLTGAQKNEATTRLRLAGATSNGDGEPLPGAVRKKAATKAGGGNLHRGRGATAWGREEEGGDNATEAGGGNLHREAEVVFVGKSDFRIRIL